MNSNFQIPILRLMLNGNGTSWSRTLPAPAPASSGRRRDRGCLRSWHGRRTYRERPENLAGPRVRPLASPHRRTRPRSIGQCRRPDRRDAGDVERPERRGQAVTTEPVRSGWPGTAWRRNIRAASKAVWPFAGSGVYAASVTASKTGGPSSDRSTPTTHPTRNDEARTIRRSIDRYHRQPPPVRGWCRLLRR